MRSNDSPGRHQAPGRTGERPPWMVPPRRRQGMPKWARRILIILAVAAVAAIAVYVYLLLNPSAARHVEYK